MKCSIDGCAVQSYARGWCRNHYERWKRHGDPLAGGTANGAPLRFLESIFTHFEDNCIIWPFGRTLGGYAFIKHDGHQRLTSRIVCERFNGKPPSPKHQSAHSCGKGHLGCINGRHLSWKTSKENRADMLAHGTMPQGERHPRARLTENDVHAIRSLAGTATQREIAGHFGVKEVTVNAIISRRNWRHI